MTTDTVMLAGPATERVEERANVQQQWKRRLPTAAQVMSRHPAVVDAQTSLFSAWGKLHGEQNRHLVVIDDDIRPIGVLDERDIALEWPPGPIGAHHLPVHKLLRFRARPQVRGEDDIVQVAKTMLTSREDALPVIDADGRLLGLITAWHCVELIAGPCGSDQQQDQMAASTPA
jgi:CBS domain-containing protein